MFTTRTQVKKTTTSTEMVYSQIDETMGLTDGMGILHLYRKFENTYSVTLELYKDREFLYYSLVNNELHVNTTHIKTNKVFSIFLTKEEAEIAKNNLYRGEPIHGKDCLSVFEPELRSVVTELREFISKSKKQPNAKEENKFYINFNPFNEVFETRKFLLAHARRTTLFEKLSACFYVLLGSFFDKEKKNHLGIFDLLTFCIPYLITYLPFKLAFEARGLAQLLLIPTALFALPFLLGRVIFAAVMTLALFIPIACIHAFTELFAGGHKFKNKIKDINIVVNPNSSCKQVRSAQEYLDGNLDRYKVDIHGSYAQIIVDFHRTVTGLSASLQCECCLNGGEGNHVAFAATFDLKKNAQHRAQFTQLLRGNVGGIVNALDEAGVNIDQLVQPELQDNSTSINTYA